MKTSILRGSTWAERISGRTFEVLWPSDRNTDWVVCLPLTRCDGSLSSGGVAAIHVSGAELLDPSIWKQL
jgi:hypothetical protein